MGGQIERQIGQISGHHGCTGLRGCQATRLAPLAEQTDAGPQIHPPTDAEHDGRIGGRQIEGAHCTPLFDNEILLLLANAINGQCIIILYVEQIVHARCVCARCVCVCVADVCACVNINARYY
jgi:hypothetical protein